MQLSKGQKTLIGILHFLPIVGFISYFVFFFVFIIGNIENIENNGNNPPNPAQFLSGFIGAFLIIIVSILIAIGVKIFDIIHLVKSNKNDTNNKVLMWVLLFVFTGIVSEIVYFFLEILPEKRNKITEEQSQNFQ
jgi:magnesium-transporting ATPase (P-type)